MRAVRYGLLPCAQSDKMLRDTASKGVIRKRTIQDSPD